ncbi:oligoendopeptidase F [Breznakiellaceae bacterium SP9]
MSTGTTIPTRAHVAAADTWDLSALFADDGAWAQGLADYEKRIEAIQAFKGTLGVSAETLAAFLCFRRDFGILEERLSYYAELRQTEDEGDSRARAMSGRFTMAAAKAKTALAWEDPELMAIPDSDMERFLASPALDEFRIAVKKIRLFKPYILSEKEERIAALYSETEGVSRETFSVLTNVDIDFGSVDTSEGPRPLSQSSWAVLMENPDRSLRQRAYTAFYQHYEQHKTTLASLYAASVKQDLVHARIRGYSSARAMALFPDQVPESVYDNLVSTVHANLGALHRYYALRKKQLKLDELRHYDVYVPIVAQAARNTPWNEAVDLVSAALSPLGSEYLDTLRAGLLGRWVDRYENKGKRSGAFSAGSYTGDPYILMNYKEDHLRDLFTLAHEGGHSMHSWYSARSNPFVHYNYTIFEAEVASTFNEDLLYRYLVKSTSDKAMEAYLVNKRIDEILATLYRQTMFAEYELRTHSLEESGTPLTLDTLRGEYRALLKTYFGPAMVLEEVSDMEGLRIPHFYNAFYVYKYATGVSASLALAERVCSGGDAERRDYFKFLTAGGSRYPIESLKLAGVDMSTQEPVEAACKIFAALVDKLETLLRV